MNVIIARNAMITFIHSHSAFQIQILVLSSVRNKLVVWLNKDLLVLVLTFVKNEIITFLYFWYQDVQNLFVAVVKLLDSGGLLKVDQEHLETVIPALGTVHVPGCMS